jgi:peptide/nickel transport system permease protein
MTQPHALTQATAAASSATSSTGALANRSTTPPPGIWAGRLYRGLFRNATGLLGLSLLALLILLAVLAPVIAPYDPLDQDLVARLQPPGAAHLLGTDQVGRDVLSRLLFGARISLTLGLTASVLGGLIGVSLGLLAGFRGGLVAALILRTTDAQIAFPYLVLAIALVAVVGPSLPALIAILAFFSWVSFARVVAADVEQVRHQEYIVAARSIGMSEGRLAVRHVLPNVLSPVIVIWTFTIAQIVVVESSLSFLGLGVQPPTPSWGSMLSDGRAYLEQGWWLSTFAGLAIMLTVVAVNFVGDALRDVLDPRTRV